MLNRKEFIIHNPKEGTWFTGGSYNSWSKFKNKASVLTEEESNNVINSGKGLGDILESELVLHKTDFIISEDINVEDNYNEMEKWLKVYDSEWKGFYLGIKKAINKFELDSTYVRRSKFYDTEEEAELARVSGNYTRKI